jgi:DNA-binding transcriptional LysR family regulator
VENFDEIIAACRRVGFSPRIVLATTRPSAILGLVSSGLGVSVLAAAFRNLAHTNVAFVPILGLSSSLRMVWAADGLAPSVARFLEVARECTAVTARPDGAAPHPGPVGRPASRRRAPGKAT